MYPEFQTGRFALEKGHGKGETGDEWSPRTRGLEGTCTVVVAYCENLVQKTASLAFRLYKIQFLPTGLRPGPRWGGGCVRRCQYRRPISQLRRGMLPRNSLPPRRFRRLALAPLASGLSAFGTEVHQRLNHGCAPELHPGKM